MCARARSVATLLGYPPEARLLIINADDFGLCHAENVATIAGLEQGVFDSATVMVPCPWFEEAVTFVRRGRPADLGVHVVHTSEWELLTWGPVCGSHAVPTLVGTHGHFHADVPSLYRQARLDEVERETRAQVDLAIAAGIDVTHLDSHMGTLQLDLAYHRLYLRLAAAYRLPIRMAGRPLLRAMGMETMSDEADQLGILMPDHFWYGGPAHPADTARYWTDRLRALPAGVNEIYVHACVDTPEARAAMPGAWEQRVADFEFFMQPSTQTLLRDLRIVRVGYRALRDRQRQLRPC